MAFQSSRAFFRMVSNGSESTFVVIQSERLRFQERNEKSVFDSSTATRLTFPPLRKEGIHAILLSRLDMIIVGKLVLETSYREFISRFNR